MAIVTLTTDFGEMDFYVPAFKGEILSGCPAVQIVDICHTVPPFDVTQAAFLLGQAYEHFPKRTIHVARVFEGNHNHLEIVVCTYNDHFFIAPNNGLLSMVFKRPPSAAVVIDYSRLKVRSPHDLYCRAIKTLVYNGSLSDLGRSVAQIEEKHMLRPIIQDSGIRGVVLHVDYFGNAITNIHREEFERGVADKTFALLIRRNDAISRISDFYTDVPEGEILARFNSHGLLEVSVNCGRADELLGIQKGDNIKIEY